MAVILFDLLDENLLFILGLTQNQTERCPSEYLEVPIFVIEQAQNRLEQLAVSMENAVFGNSTIRVVLFALNHENFQKISWEFSLAILCRYHKLARTERGVDFPLEFSEKLISTDTEVMAPRPEGLYLALVKSSLVRHFRILRDRNERGKLDKGKRPLNEATQMPQASESITANTTTANPPEIKPSAAKQRVGQGDEERSATLSTMSSTGMDELQEATGPTELDSTRAQKQFAPIICEADGASYPGEPKIPIGCEEGTCPICRQVLPAEELRGPKWIAHVNKDIQPYVCLSGNCLRVTRFFESRSQWLDHMHSFHGPWWIVSLQQPVKWCCWEPGCSAESNVAFIYKKDRKADLSRHLQESHPQITEERKEFLLEWSTGPGPFRSSKECPICGTVYEPNLRTEATREASKSQEAKVECVDEEILGGEDDDSSVENSSDEPRTRVENCIANHLKNLALSFTALLLEDES
ncbi:hypothetical protein F4808DRAFT_466166 [Astrocystis sublimbata]|nr:hypothetical protein F4808DRAFT_466166 [Astrocystis sublimbata]